MATKTFFCYVRIVSTAYTKSAASLSGQVWTSRKVVGSEYQLSGLGFVFFA